MTAELKLENIRTNGNTKDLRQYCFQLVTINRIPKKSDYTSAIKECLDMHNSRFIFTPIVYELWVSRINVYIVAMSYSRGTCLIRHSFGQEKCVGLTNCRIRRVKMQSKTLICVEILSDPENSGLYRFHCIMKITALALYTALDSFGT